jgi:glyoxylase-like metal-dependent hydrolase (beta-lactamase superfamily II)
MTQQIPLIDADRAPMREEADGTTSIAADLSYMRALIVNVVFYGLPGPNSDWVLIDTALGVSRGAIEEAAAKRFGSRPPVAIILTHGHFDHVGSVAALAEKWDVPVYAHPLEHPYLNGSASYPPPDPWVGGGLIAMSAPLMPRGPIDLGARLRALPEDGSVPGMPDWRWVHTPGHAPGHVSIWRAADRTLIVGDAFVTTAQESVYDVATQELEMHVRLATSRRTGSPRIVL